MTRSMVSTTHRSEVHNMLDLVELKPGLKFSKAVLKDLLPDVETALFFGKVYELDYSQLSNLLHTVLDSQLAQVLFAGDHSTDLQGYLSDVYEDADAIDYWGEEYDEGDISYAPVVPKGEILPELWKDLEVEVARSIKEVAAKLESTIGMLPGKQGQMMFQSMRVLNAKRPVLGDYRAHIHHAPQKQNLVIFDVSGSMNAATVRAIVDDVVALSYNANAHMAIVSDTCTYWAPGTYDTAAILAAAEYNGTHYEKLAPLFDRDWGTVITIADYDSYHDARDVIARCAGHIDQVLDISLVNRPTFMAECVGQIADNVRPLLIAQSTHVLTY